MVRCVLVLLFSILIQSSMVVYKYSNTYDFSSCFFLKVLIHAFSEPQYQNVHSSAGRFMFSPNCNKMMLSLKLKPHINCQQLPRTRVADSRPPCAIENHQKVHFF